MNKIARLSTIKETVDQKGKEAVEKVIYGYLGNSQEWCVFNLTIGTIADIAVKPLELLLKQLNALPDK